MYEDSWYSFVPNFQQQQQSGPTSAPKSSGGRQTRKLSLLQQPENAASTSVPDIDEPFEEDLYAEGPTNPSPPEATLPRRAQSLTDLAAVAASPRPNPRHVRRKSGKSWSKTRGYAALDIAHDPPPDDSHESPPYHDSLSLFDSLFTNALIEAGQQDSVLYHDELAMTERHLNRLIDDVNGALKVLESLSSSFKSVEDQTSGLQSQCEHLVSEQRRLQNLADAIGTDLHYYAYLENITRRLNAPGASRLVDGDMFGEMLDNLDACIVFMADNPSYRDSESYLARYKALLTKAMHLLDVGFSQRLDKVSAEMSRQLATTKSESARHALIYGRYEELMLDSYSLIPNVQKVVGRAYDESGHARSGPNMGIHLNTANAMFRSYLTARDRDLAPIAQRDVDEFRTQVKDLYVETAARNLVKQSFERSYDEAVLFLKLFAIEPEYNAGDEEVTAFSILKSHPGKLVTGVNLVPIAASLQPVLSSADLQTTCNVVGWIRNEYLLVDYDDDDSAFPCYCRVQAARLLSEHLWALTDMAFEGEIAKSISKTATTPTSALSLSDTFPPVKRALELLVLFDQAMPKERCQRNSPVVFKIVTGAMTALQDAEQSVKTKLNNTTTDPDLFMVKNLLILKNELISLEFGDVRGEAADAMRHFSQIWDTLNPGKWVGFLSTRLSGLGSYMPISLPISMPWNRSASVSGSGPPAPPSWGGGDDTTSVKSRDASDQLDEMLRQSIYAFTQRWGQLVHQERARRAGAKNLGQVMLDLGALLDEAFRHQPEIAARLKEAVQISAQAQAQGQTGVGDGAGGERRV